MWTNITGVVGAAIQKVQKIQNELEAQMDQAVGKDGNLISTSSSSENPPPASEAATPPLRSTGRETPAEPVDQEAPAAGDGEFTTIEINEASHSLEGKTASIPEAKKVVRKVSKSKVKASASTNNISDAPIITAAAAAASSPAVPCPESVRDANEMQERLAREMEALKVQHNEAFRLLDQQHVLSMEQMKSSHAQELAKTKGAGEEKLLKQEQICNERVEAVIKQKGKELEEERLRFEERIKLLQSESTKPEGETIPSVSLAVHEAEVGDYKHKVHKYEQQISELLKQVGALTSDNRKLNEDIVKCREVVSERERALESSNVKLSELVSQADSLSAKCQDLANEIVEKDKMLKQLQLSSSDDVESKKQTTRLLEQVQEQAKRLHAFETEGQQLAKKQSEMEKTVRKSKQESKEKEQEIAKLKESKEQLVKAIEQTQEALKKAEAEAAGHQKSLQAMNAVSQASTDKINKLEQEVQGRQEEISSQKKALESAWGDNNELKKVIIELKAERDDLRKQLGEGSSKVMETESNKRDIEQREAVLRATSRQLEETLKQSMADHNQREERLRSELNAMQKRWQEAILAREQLASELTQVTSPLLKQITSLQDQMRMKHEGFMNIEASLNEKILKLESSLETAEHRKALGEEESMLVKQQYLSVSGQLKDMIEKLANCEATVDKLKRLEREYTEDKKTLESKLAYETGQNKSGQQALKELEMKHKIEVTEWEEKLNALRNSSNIEISRLKAEVGQLQEQLKAERSNHGGNGNNRKKGGFRGGSSGEEGNTRDNATTRGENTFSGQLEINPALPTLLPSGEMSFAASEQLQQRTRQRDDELYALQQQVYKLELARTALLDEVSFLSGKNAQLEEDGRTLDSLRGELESTAKQRNVLLVLLGEKEEELEAAMNDMKEVRQMYQTHIQDLLDQLAPPSNPLPSTTDAFIGGIAAGEGDKEQKSYQ